MFTLHTHTHTYSHTDVAHSRSLLLWFSASLWLPHTHNAWNFAHIYNNCKCVENRLHNSEQQTAATTCVCVHVGVWAVRECVWVSLCVGVCLTACSFVKGKWPLSVSRPVCVCGSMPECVWECVLAVSAAMFFSASFKAQAPVRTLREIKQSKVEVNI